MTADLREAMRLLAGGGYTAVLVKGDDTVTSTQRGIRPLVDWLGEGKSFAGYSAADKIAGKAAALLYIKMGVKELYADVLSEPAQAALKKHGVAASFGCLTPEIKNRAGDGICPMDAAAAGIDSPDEAARVLSGLVYPRATGETNGI